MQTKNSTIAEQHEQNFDVYSIELKGGSGWFAQMVPCGAKIFYEDGECKKSDQLRLKHG